MRYSFVPLVATTIFTLTSATVQIPAGTTHKDNWGNAIVENKCSFDIYYILDNNQGRDTISPGSNVKVPVYEKNADKGGMSIKLFKDPKTDIWSKPSVTQFELTATTQLFYDISNVNSNIGTGRNGNGEDLDKEPPFMHDGMKMSAPDGKEATCEIGVNPCKNAYSLYNDDFATAATDLGNDVTLTICPGGKSSSGGDSNKKDDSNESSTGGDSNKNDVSNDSSSQQADVQPQATSKPSESSQAPKPSPTVQVEQKAKVDGTGDDEEAEIVYVTHVVQAPAETQVVYARSPADAKEKRQEHIHQHIHNKIHKRRHEA